MFIPDVTPIPPINVVVQQTPGMPEWVRLVVSAGTGAVFAIAASIVMEYVKPYITKTQMRKTVTMQLIAELKENLNKVESGAGILEEEAENNDTQTHAMSIASMILSSVSDDRYTFYFGEQKALVYEIDGDKSLSEFYSSLESGPSYFEKFEYDKMRLCFRYATLVGHRFLRHHHIAYKYDPTIYDALHRKK